MAALYQLQPFSFCTIRTFTDKPNCTTIHRYQIFSMRHSVMCKVYSGYCSTSEIEHGLCACTVDNPLAKARGLSLRTGAQTMLYLSHGTLAKRIDTNHNIGSRRLPLSICCPHTKIIPLTPSHDNKRFMASCETVT